MTYKFEIPPDKGPTMDDYPLVKLAEERMLSLERAGIVPEVLVVSPEFSPQFKRYMTEYLGLMFDPDYVHRDHGLIVINGRKLFYFTNPSYSEGVVKCYGDKNQEPKPSI